MWRFNPLLLRLLGEISLSLLCSHSSQLPGFSFGFGPTSACRSPEGVCSSLRQDGVKGAAASGALAHSARGEGGVRMWDEPAAAEARVTLHQPEAHRAVSQGSCPWITGAWKWRLHRLPGGAVWRVTCAHTQASWWPQQP